MTTDDQLYATCAAGLETLLASELVALGIPEVQTAGSGVRFGGGVAMGYRACLWSRVANRVLLPLGTGEAATPEALYDRVQEIDWSSHLDVDGTLAVDFFTAKSQITHSQYGALKAKDAVVDQFRTAFDRRPNVDREQPDIRINIYLFRDRARIALDLSGSSLHRRAYRENSGPAPLKENLAAALLLAANWPERVAAGEAFADPLCGSGTLLIEAAMIACQRAPGLGRSYFGFLKWKQHDAGVWQNLLDEANQLVCQSPVTIVGSDSDAVAVNAARQNLTSAGLQSSVQLECIAIEQGLPRALASVAPGLLLTNPPYGERLPGGAGFYAAMGQALNRHYGGWSIGIFTAREAPMAAARLPLLTRTLDVRNGGIDCSFMLGKVPATRAGYYQADTASKADESQSSSTDAIWADAAQRRATASPGMSSEHLLLDSAITIGNPGAGSAVTQQETNAPDTRVGGQPGRALYQGATVADIDVTPFTNRVRKNQRALKGWLKQKGIQAYRIYDADLPEFAVAIDVYNTQPRHCVVQEYQAPATVNSAMATARLDALMQCLPALIDVQAHHLHLKVRERKSGTSQYQKLQDNKGAAAVEVLEEQGIRYELNFSDYLDTGLFLDHRRVRRYIRENAAGKRFLNLFSYTGSATVAAVAGGASSSVSVDLSKRYSEWAARNLALNGADLDRHQVVRQDVMGWLADSIHSEPFDLILLDPPTFSNSTGVDEDWNLQRDHVAAIELCLQRLSENGLLIFSNNFRRFKINSALGAGLQTPVKIEDRSRWSIERDFQRNPRIHQCWFINPTRRS
ncbi:MAG: bifunctional 23S rRNA (guanine(2069)-N(7))-methyltransferase RlmK/23S rRNA (guanine(2445)-N(2))-methyltransferase RlmL [Granulosicoccus sp.]